MEGGGGREVIDEYISFTRMSYKQQGLQSPAMAVCMLEKLKPLTLHSTIPIWC